MRRYKNTNKVLAFCGMVLLLGTTISACKKYANPAPYFEEYGEVVVKPSRRVLIVSIDGAVGAEVKKVNPVTIAAMLKTSKYSFSAVSEAKTNASATWVSMMTGVSMSKHGIIDDSYKPAPGPDEHAAPKYYPSFLSRILDIKPEFKTVTLTSDAALNKYFIEADHRILSSNDAATKDSTLKVLQAEDPSVVIANFKEVEMAGTGFGFSADVPEYKAAIVKTDGYLGEIMESLKKRKNFGKEDWLVIVTSNHGGIGKSFGGNSSVERNIFSIYYNPAFKPFEMNVKPFYSVRLYGKGDDPAIVAAGGVVRATADDPAGIYNPGSGSMTIEAKVLFNKNASGNYSYNVPPFLSKTNDRTGSIAGWSFFRNNNGVTFYVANGAANQQITAPTVGTDGKWHTITGTIARVGADYKVNFFVDGSKAVAEGIISNAGTNLVTSPSPVVMGYQPSVFSGGYVDMHMADVKIWNKVLSDDAIKNNVAVADVPVTDPNYSNLIGYWPANEGGGNIFLNKATVANAANFKVSGNYNWALLGAAVPASYANIDPNAVLFQNIDVASQLLYWLKIPIKPDWGLDATTWLSKFEIEFLKP
ncbi:alkaline phosphatase family protein [Pedobacter caeni]|uniref:Type I phosphodiesterase / nucleotide pyrophosphatase n=1 Tax=Pedobacter caeni TaxID=288992 RepID=A0A1M5P8V5_9SPHI|nr:alkaline phosphatase family protein [Pedobacter caeni]SHG98251.1 Type I phosphodiesterase / nucleotide pyrophosphatase [Pedobacter caeni]